MVLVAGGITNGPPKTQTLASAELFDTATGQFAQTGNMNSARCKIRDAVVVLRDGRVLVAGGGTQVEVYDPASGVFRLVKGHLRIVILGKRWSQKRTGHCFD